MSGDQGVVDGEVDRVGSVAILDWLVLLAENARLLVLAPVVAGLVAWGGSQFLPRTFLSEAILYLPVAVDNNKDIVGTRDWSPVQVASIMASPVVLDPVIESQGLRQGRSMEEARSAALQVMRVVIGKDGFLRIHVNADSPEKARNIGNAWIDSWLAVTIPSPQQRVQLEERLAYAQQSLKSFSLVIEDLKVNPDTSLTSNLMRGESGMSLVALGELQARYFRETIDIAKRLNGVTREVVLLPPTLPTEPVGPDVPRIVSMTVFAGFFAALLAVLARQTWLHAMSRPGVRAQWQRVRAAWGLRA